MELKRLEPLLAEDNLTRVCDLIDSNVRRIQEQHKEAKKAYDQAQRQNFGLPSDPIEQDAQNVTEAYEIIEGKRDIRTYKYWSREEILTIATNQIERDGFRMNTYTLSVRPRTRNGVSLTHTELVVEHPWSTSGGSDESRYAVILNVANHQQSRIYPTSSITMSSDGSTATATGHARDNWAEIAYLLKTSLEPMQAIAQTVEQLTTTQPVDLNKPISID
jgi:hypothetical protein